MNRFVQITLAGTLLLNLGCGDSASLPASAVGDPAPPFTLTEVSTEKEFRSDTLKGNDVVLVNFWSTSCRTCMMEVAELNEIHSAGQAKVVGIAVGGSKDQIKKVVTAKGLEYPVLAGNEEVFTQYDGFNIPYTLVLDSKMTIREKFFGPIPSDRFK